MLFILVLVLEMFDCSWVFFFLYLYILVKKGICFVLFDDIFICVESRYECFIDYDCDVDLKCC